MQTKKRAKPVKFGSTSNSGNAEDTAEKESDDLSSAEEKEINETEEAAVSDEKSPEEEPKEKELEAHISTTIQTVDITETVKEDLEKEEQAPAEEDKSAPAEIPKEQVKDDSKQEMEIPEEDSVVEEESTDAVDESTDQASEPVEQDSAFFNEPPDNYEGKKSTKGYFFLVAFITFLLGLTFFAGIYYAVINKGQNNLFGAKPTAEPTHETVTEKPTPKPVDLSLYTVKVLNGTSVSGVAAQLKTKLTDAGFKVGPIGNADKADYVSTEIAANKKVDTAYLEKLRGILKKSYALSSTSTLASGDADVVITIGSAPAK